MGRPLKQGLDYFSVDVDFFQSAKVRRIIKACGAKSVSVLICLLANVYRKDGYFMKWDGDMGCLIAEETGLDIGTSRTELMVTDVLSKALSVGFFDAGIFNEYGVLTSEGIQERYFSAIERRKKIEIIKEYFLLDPSEVSKNAVWKSATTMPKNRFFAEKTVNVDKNQVNVSKNPVNVDINPQSKGKESKGKERERKVEEVNVSKNSVNVDINPQSREIPATTLPASVLMSYQENIRLICNSIEQEKLADDVARFGEETVIKAIERAVIRGKRNIGYVEGILRRWETDGYDEEVQCKSPGKENPQLAMAQRAIQLLRGESNGQGA
jgi:DnaD/phage-associated family protein